VALSKKQSLTCFPRPDIFREATEPQRWKYHLDVDPQFIHMGHPLFDVAHFLLWYRHALLLGAAVFPSSRQAPNFDFVCLFPQLG
jgi:hypothetical protein